MLSAIRFHKFIRELAMPVFGDGSFLADLCEARLRETVGWDVECPRIGETLCNARI